MIDPLAPLLADGVIDEVVARLKSGKEADLWLVRHGTETLAAKVYKAREARSFKNNAAYREGRRVRDTRTQRAMARGSRFGQAAAEEAWKAKESDALHTLHAAGVRVPRPVMFYEGVLLMELVVDPAGHPAPRLVDARVAREQAVALYTDLRGQAIRMLCADLIHGDLSPYNVLLAWNGPVIIDFPQVVGAAHNTQAEGFFSRDLQNLRRHLAGVDPALHAASGDANEIWRAYVRRELTPEFVPTGRAPEPRREQRGRGERPPQQGGRPAPHVDRLERQVPRPHPQGARPPPQGARPRPQPEGPHLQPQGVRPPHLGPRNAPQGRPAEQGRPVGRGPQGRSTQPGQAQPKGRPPQGARPSHPGPSHPGSPHPSPTHHAGTVTPGAPGSSPAGAPKRRRRRRRRSGRGGGGPST